MKKSLIYKIIIILVLMLVSIFALFPLIRTFFYSFYYPDEIKNILKSRNNFDSAKWIYNSLAPRMISLNQHYKIFIGDPAILKYFLNSVMYTTLILLGQALFIPSIAFALSKIKFKGREIIFFMIIVLMILPFQVTMSPNILTLRSLGLLSTIWAVILPSMFSPFYIFLMRQYMLSVPNELLEAAALDGKGPIGTYLQVVLPVCRPIIGAALSLSFADTWNMVEQPIAFLSAKQHLMPLSVMFNTLGDQNADIAFAGAVLYILPAMFVFFYFQNDIVEGLQLSELK